MNEFPSSPVSETREAVAFELWQRFAPVHHIGWADETHKAEYYAAADGVLTVLRDTERPPAATERDPWGQVRNQPRDLAQCQQERLPTYGNLLADINKAAHAAGTNAWVRDVLKRAHRAIRLSAPLAVSDTSTICQCGGDPGQPADHHDISCPAAISSPVRPCPGCDGHECDNGCAYPGASK